jgi:chemotaxis protein histidine kinase CheA
MLLSQDDINKYKTLYFQTAREYLENMQLNISHLLKDEQKEAAIKQIHIDAHSLKGQSQVMGYSNISKISETIEYIFNKYEKENNEVKYDTLIKIQKALSALLDSTTQIEKTGKELDLTGIINELEGAK